MSECNGLMELRFVTRTPRFRRVSEIYGAREVMAWRKAIRRGAGRADD